MYLSRMNLKDVRMCRVGFEFPWLHHQKLIKIKELFVFCAAGYTTGMSKSKINVIANVCALDHSFIGVMFDGIGIDNILTVLFVC